MTLMTTMTITSLAFPVSRGVFPPHLPHHPDPAGMLSMAVLYQQFAVVVGTGFTGLCFPRCRDNTARAALPDPARSRHLVSIWEHAALVSHLWSRPAARSLLRNK